MHTVSHISYILASLSILGASLVLACLFFIWLYDSRLMDRISLRLSAGISIVDIFKSLAYCLYLSKLEGLGCQLTAFLKLACILCQATLTVSVALNLQLAFLQGLPRRRWWEYLYWAIGLGLPITIAVSSAATPSFLGKNSVTGLCFYSYPKEENYSKHSLWFGFLGWTLFGTVYFLIIGGLSIRKLFLCVRTLRHTEFEDGGSLPTKPAITKESIPLLIKRVCFYCFVPLLTFSGCLTELIWGEVYHEYPRWILFWDILVSNLSGILNFIGFLHDPALRNGLSCIHQDLISLQSTYDSKEPRISRVRSSMHLHGGGKWDPKCSNEINKIIPGALSDLIKYHRHPWVCKFFCWLLVTSNHQRTNDKEYPCSFFSNPTYRNSLCLEDSLENDNRLSIPLCPLVSPSSFDSDGTYSLNLDLPGALIDFPFLHAFGSSLSLTSYNCAPICPGILITPPNGRATSNY